MAIAGFSGMGKSTLALHLLNHGATFVTNDRLLVEARKQELTMYGVAKLPRINPGTALNNSALTCLLSSSEREEFSTLSQEDLWQVEYKYDVPIDKCFGQGRFELGGTMSELIILNWHYLDKRCQMTEVSIASRYDLLEAFWKNPGLFFLNHEGQTIDLSFDRYAEMLSCCRVFEITGGIDFQKASQQCMDIMHAAY
jgi:HprK-related kinase B